jgi:hypothetical protein
MRTLLCLLLILFTSFEDESDKAEIILRFEKRVSFQVDFNDKPRVIRKKCTRNIHDAFIYYEFRFHNKNSNPTVNCSYHELSYTDLYKQYEDYLKRHFFCQTYLDKDNSCMYTIEFLDSLQLKVVRVECFKMVENAPNACALLFQIHNNVPDSELMQYSDLLESIINSKVYYLE